MRSVPEPLSRSWASLRARPFRAAYAALLALLVLGAAFSFVHFDIGVHALYARHATGPSWSFPSRIYSDGVGLAPGRALPEGYLLAHLEARGYRRDRGRRGAGRVRGRPRGIRDRAARLRRRARPRGRGRARARAPARWPAAGSRRSSAWAACPAAPRPTRRGRRGSSRWRWRCSPTRTACCAPGCRWRASRARCARRSWPPRTGASASTSGSTCAAACAPSRPTCGPAACARAPARSRSRSRAGSSSATSAPGAASSPRRCSPSGSRRCCRRTRSSRCT